MLQGETGTAHLGLPERDEQSRRPRPAPSDARHGAAPVRSLPALLSEGVARAARQEVEEGGDWYTGEDGDWVLGFHREQ